MKKLILAIFLILPFAVNAEDLTAEVKLYETVENDYTYTARIKSNENDIYYLKVKPNYEYTSIKYATSSDMKYKLASDSTQPFFKAWAFYEQGDTFIATVTKTDNTVVKYRVIVAPNADKTIYIDTVEDTNNNQVIENNQTVENNNNQKATSNNVKNPNTGDNILLMSGMFVLVTTIIGVSFKKIKSNS